MTNSSPSAKIPAQFVVFVFLLFQSAHCFDEVRVTAAEALKDQAFSVRIQIYQSLPSDGVIAVSFPPSFSFGDGIAGNFAIVTVPLTWTPSPPQNLNFPGIAACRLNQTANSMFCFLDGQGSTVPALSVAEFVVSSIRNGPVGYHQIGLATMTRAGQTLDSCSTPVLVGPGIFGGNCPPSGSGTLKTPICLDSASSSPCGALVQLGNFGTGAVTFLSVSIAVDKTLPANTLIEVVMPIGFDILSSATLSSTTLPGMFLDLSNVGSRIFTVSLPTALDRKTARAPFGFRIDGVRNPSTTGTFSTALILRLRQSSALIDEKIHFNLDIVPTPIAIQMAQLSTVFFPDVVNQASSLTVTFVITSSNLTAGFYLAVQLSPSLSMEASATASTLASAPSGSLGPSTSVLLSSTSIRVSFGVQNVPASTRLAFSISGIRNPSNVGRVAVGVYLYATDNTLVESGVVGSCMRVGNWTGACTGRTCGLCVDATAISADLPYSQGSLTFRGWSAQTAPAGSSLEMILPVGWNVSGNSVATTTLSNGIVQTSVCVETRTIVAVFGGSQAISSSVLAAGFSVTVSNIRSPLATKSDDSFSVRLLGSGGGAIEAGVTYLVVRTGALSVTIPQNGPYRDTAVSMTFTIPSGVSFPPLTPLVITFPRSANNFGFEVIPSFTLNQAVRIEVTGVTTSPTSMVCTKATLATLSCALNNTAEIPQNTQLSFTIPTVRLPEPGAYDIRFSTTGCSIIAASSRVTISPGILNATLTPLCPLVAGAAIAFRLSISQFSHPVPALDAILLTLPSAFNFSNGASSVTSPSVLMGVPVVDRLSSGSVFIRIPIISALMGGSESAGISFNLQGVLLPSQNTAESQSAPIVSLVTGSGSVVVDTAQLAGLTVAGTSISLAVTLETSTALAAGPITFSFTPTSDLSSGSVITFTLSADSPPTTGLPLLAPSTSGTILTSGTSDLTCVKAADTVLRCTTTALKSANAAITVTIPSSGVRNAAPGLYRARVTAAGPTSCTLFSGDGAFSVSPGALNVTATSTCPLVVGSVLSLDLTISLGTYLPAASSRLTLVLPASTMKISNSSAVFALAISTLTMSTYLVDPVQNAVTISLGGTDLIQSQAQAGIIFRISSVTLLNAATAGSTTIGARLSNGAGVMLASASSPGPAVTGASIPVSLSLNSYRAYQAGNYSLQFVPSQAIAVNGKIQLDMPSTFTVTTEGASVVSGVSGIQCTRLSTSSLSCTFTVAQPAGTSITLSFSTTEALLNPEPGVGYAFALSSKDPNSCTLFGGTVSLDIISGTWLTASVSPICPLIAGGSAGFTVSLTASHLIPSTDIIEIVFSSQVIVSNSSVAVVPRSLGTLSLSTTPTVSGGTTGGPTFVNIQLGGTTMTSQAARASGISFDITGLSLPQTTSSGPFTVRLVSGRTRAIVDASDVAALAVTGSSVAVSLLLSTSTSYGLGNFTISFVVPTNITAGSKFVISFQGFSVSAAALNVISSPSSVSCSITSSTLSCITPVAISASSGFSLTTLDATSLTNPALGTASVQVSAVTAAGCSIFGGSTSVTINEAQLSTSVAFSCATLSGAVVSATFTVIADHMIPASDTLFLLFPFGITLSNVTTAVAVSTGTLGAVTVLQIDLASRTLLLSFSGAGPLTAAAARQGISFTVTALTITGAVQLQTVGVEVRELIGNQVTSPVSSRGLTRGITVASSAVSLVVSLNAFAHVEQNFTLSISSDATFPANSVMKITFPTGASQVGFQISPSASATGAMGLRGAPTGVTCTKLSYTQMSCLLATGLSASTLMSLSFLDTIRCPETGTYTISTVVSLPGCSDLTGSSPIQILVNQASVALTPTCPLVANTITDAVFSLNLNHLISIGDRLLFIFPSQFRITANSSVSVLSGAAAAYNVTYSVETNSISLFNGAIVTAATAAAGISYSVSRLQVGNPPSAGAPSIQIFTNGTMIDSGSGSNIPIATAQTSVTLALASNTAYSENNFTITLFPGVQIAASTRLIFDFDQPGFQVSPFAAVGAAALIGAPSTLSCNKISISRLECVSSVAIAPGTFSFTSTTPLRNPPPGSHTMRFTGITAGSSSSCSSVYGTTSTAVVLGQLSVLLNSSCPLVTLETIDIDVSIQATSPTIFPSPSRLIISFPKPFITGTSALTAVDTSTLQLGSLTLSAWTFDVAANHLIVDFSGSSLTTSAAISPGIFIRVKKLVLGTQGVTPVTQASLYSSDGILALQGAASPLVIVAATVPVTMVLATQAPYSEGNFSISFTPATAIVAQSQISIQFPTDDNGVGFALQSSAGTVFGTLVSCVVSTTTILVCTFSQSVAAGTAVTIMTTAANALRNPMPGTYNVRVTSRTSAGCALFAGVTAVTFQVGTWTPTFEETCPLVSATSVNFLVTLKAGHVIPAGDSALITFPVGYLTFTNTTTVAARSMGSLSLFNSSIDHVNNQVMLMFGGSTMPADVASSTGVSFLVSNVAVAAGGATFTSNFVAELRSKLGVIVDGGRAAGKSIQGTTLASSLQLTSNIAYSPTPFTLSFTPPSNISMGSVLTIHFPQGPGGEGFTLSTTATTVTSTVPVVCSRLDSQRLSCTFSVTHVAGALFQLQATASDALRTPAPAGYVVTTSAVTSTGCPIFSGSASVAVTVASWNVTVQSDCPLVAGVTTNFVLTLGAYYRIPSGNRISIVAPSTFLVLNTTQISVRFSSSLSIASSAVEPTSNSISIVLGGASVDSATDPPGISFVLTGIKLPDAATTTNPFVASLINTASTIVSSGQSAVQSVTGSVVSVSCSLLTSNVAYFETNFSVAFTPPRTIPATSRILVAFPKTTRTFNLAASVVVSGTPAGTTCSVSDSQTLTCVVGTDITAATTPISLIISPNANPLVNGPPGNHLVQVSAVSSTGCTLFGGTASVTVQMGTWSASLVESCQIVAGGSVDFTLTVKAPHILYAGDVVFLTLPSGAFSVRNSTVVSAVSMQTLTVASFTPSPLTNDVSVTLGGSNLATSQSSSTGISFLISGLAVGSAASVSGNFRVDLMTPGKGTVVATASVGGKAIVDSAVSLVVALDTSSAYSVGGLRATFSPVIDLPIGSKLTLVLPTSPSTQGFLITDTTMTLSSGGSCSRQGSNTVVCTLSTLAPKSTSIMISVSSGVGNPETGGYTAALTAVGPSGCTLATGSAVIQISVAALNVTVTTNCRPVAGTLSTLIFSLQGTLKIPAGDTLRIDVPSSLTVSDSTIASLANAGSLFISSVARSASSLTLTLGGTTLDAATFTRGGVTLTLSNILLPPSAVDSLLITTTLLTRSVGGATPVASAQGSVSNFAVTGSSMGVTFSLRTSGAYDIGNFSVEIKPVDALSVGAKLVLQFPAGIGGGRGFVVAIGSGVGATLGVSSAGGGAVSSCVKSADRTITCTISTAIVAGGVMSLMLTDTAVLMNAVPGTYSVAVSTTDASGCALSGGAGAVNIVPSSLSLPTPSCQMSAWSANVWTIAFTWHGLISATDIFRVKFPTGSIGLDVTTKAASSVISGGNNVRPSIASSTTGLSNIDLFLTGSDASPTGAATLYQFGVANAFVAQAIGTGSVRLEILSGPSYVNSNGTSPLIIAAGEVAYSIAVPAAATLTLTSATTLRRSTAQLDLFTIIPQTVSVVFPQGFDVGAGSTTLATNSTSSGVSVGCSRTSSLEFGCAVQTLSSSSSLSTSITVKDISNPSLGTYIVSLRQWTTTCGSRVLFQSLPITPGCGSTLTLTSPKPRYPNATMAFVYSSRVTVPAASSLTLTLPDSFFILSADTQVSINPSSLISSISYFPSTQDAFNSSSTSRRQVVTIITARDFNGWFPDSSITITWTNVRTIPQDGSQTIPTTLNTFNGVNLDSCQIPGLPVVACLLNAELGLVSAGVGPRPLTVSFVPIRAVSPFAVIEITVEMRGRGSIVNGDLGSTSSVRWYNAKDLTQKVGHNVRSCALIASFVSSLSVRCYFDGAGGDTVPAGILGILSFGQFVLPDSAGYYSASVSLRQSDGAAVDQSATTRLSLAPGAFTDQTCLTSDGKCVASFLPDGGQAMRSSARTGDLWNVQVTTAINVNIGSILGLVLNPTINYSLPLTSLSLSTTLVPTDSVNSRGTCAARAFLDSALGLSTLGLLIGGLNTSTVYPPSATPFLFAISPFARASGFCQAGIYIKSTDGGLSLFNINPWGTPPCDMGRFGTCGFSDPGQSDATCRPCVQGTFQNSFAKSFCITCPAGKWTHIPAATDASMCRDPCSAGNYFDTAANTCTACPAKFFQPIPGQAYCVFCGEDGNSNPGSTSASACSSYTLPSNAVLAQITFALSYSEVTASPLAQATFATSVMTSVARVLAINTTQLQVADMRSGSVIVDLLISASTKSAAQLLLDNLMSQLANSSSPLRQDSLLNGITDIIQSSQPGSANSNGGTGPNVGIIVGVVVGGVVLLGAIGAIAFLIYRRSQNQSNGVAATKEIEMTRNPAKIAWGGTVAQA